MAERGRRALRQSRDRLQIGASRLDWRDGALEIAFDEPAFPVGRRLRGTVRLQPQSEPCGVFALDAGGRHLWGPIAPRARVEVEVEGEAPWRGDGYFDANFGEEPIEAAFVEWDWSRLHRADETLLFYDVLCRDGTETNLALRIPGSGGAEEIDGPPRRPLPTTLWRLPRRARGEGLRLRRTLEDTPFYSRSLLAGEDGAAVHESLFCDRLASPIVKAMLPFRMPRLPG